VSAFLQVGGKTVGVGVDIDVVFGVADRAFHGVAPFACPLEDIDDGYRIRTTVPILRHGAGKSKGVCEKNSCKSRSYEISGLLCITRFCICCAKTTIWKKL
jgi:hypothetical protein